MFYTCDKCKLVKDESSWEDFSTCEICQSCESNLIPFVTFDLTPQLVQILTKDKFVQISNNMRKCRLNMNGPINNAMDGSVYRDFLDNHLNSDYAVSLNINSDGAPLVNSKNISMWPLMAYITELNPSSRESFSNLL